jgi:hypothetical protein
MTSRQVGPAYPTADAHQSDPSGAPAVAQEDEMGFLDSILGHKDKEQPPLDPQSSAARRLEQHRAAIDGFASRVKDRLELVPGPDTVYVFIGKPPDAFGIAWIRGDQEHNLKTLMKARNLSAQTIQNVSEMLRSSYAAHRDEPRFQATAGGKRITVIPSDAFALEVQRIVREVEAA